MLSALHKFLVYIRRVLQTLWYSFFLIPKSPNWYDYYLDIFGLKKEDWIFKFHNGLKIKVRKNSVDRFCALDSLILNKSNIPFFDGLEFDSIFDVGAHIGDSFLDLADTYKEAHIVAIEPMPDTVALLKENVSLNDFEQRVTVYEAALTSEYSGEIEFFTNRDDAGGSLVRDLSGKTIKVKAIALSDIEKHIEGNSLFKIDIEGGEYDIFTEKNLDFLKKFNGMIIETHYVDEERNHEYIGEFLEKHKLGEYIKKGRFYYLRSK